VLIHLCFDITRVFRKMHLSFVAETLSFLVS